MPAGITGRTPDHHSSDTYFNEDFTMAHLLSPIPSARPRYDMYAGIHKGMRAFMCEMLTRLGALDAEDETEVSDTLSAFYVLMDFCHNHLAHEDTVIHPALETAVPGSTRQADAEHAEHDTTLELLRAQAARVAAARGALRAGEILRLYRLFAVFVGESFIHMHMEETDHNTVLWHAYDDASLAAIEQRIHAVLDPAEAALALRWMVPAMTPAERVGLLEGMRRSAPPQVFEASLGIIAPHLSPGDWARLSGALESAARQAATAAA